MARQARPKVKIGISLDADLYEWLQENTGVGQDFASISHAIERIVARYRTELAQRSTREHARGAHYAHGLGRGVPVSE